MKAAMVNRVLACVALTIGILPTSGQVLAQQSLQARKEMTLEPSDLDRNAGVYELAPRMTLAITREGTRIYAQVTGQIKAEIFPESTQEFFYKIVDAQITFLPGDDGRATSLILHQFGRDVPAKRVEIPTARPDIAAIALPPDTDESEVTLDIGSGVLHGTILTPTKIATPPIVLIIAGSGPTDRNGNSQIGSGHNDSLRLLAQALAASGIASLRYDKRGVGGSRGALRNESDVRFDDLVDDAAGWVHQLQAGHRYSTVTIIGHSEGSLIGMLATQKSHANAFVSISGPARRASEVLRDQLRSKLTPQLADESEVILRALENGKQVDNIPAALMPLYRPSVQPYLISWLRYTPTEVVGNLSVPVLIVQGTTDIQVGVEEAKALKKAQPHAELANVEGMNHVLKIVPADDWKQLASYTDPSLPIAPDLVTDLVRFVQRVR
jgi:pimeloyl-ACP methyl ester carboxylesterase